MCRLNLSSPHKRANSICWFWICSKFLTPAATDSEVPSTSKSLQRTHWLVLLNRFLGCFVDLMQVVEPAHGGSRTRSLRSVQFRIPQLLPSFLPLRLSENQVDKNMNIWTHINWDHPKITKPTDLLTTSSKCERKNLPRKAKIRARPNSSPQTHHLSSSFFT
jgi:hypothetical protein